VPWPRPRRAAFLINLSARAFATLTSNRARTALTVSARLRPARAKASGRRHASTCGVESPRGVVSLAATCSFTVSLRSQTPRRACIERIHNRHLGSDSSDVRRPRIRHHRANHLLSLLERSHHQPPLCDEPMAGEAGLESRGRVKSARRFRRRRGGVIATSAKSASSDAGPPLRLTRARSNPFARDRIDGPRLAHQMPRGPESCQRSSRGRSAPESAKLPILAARRPAKRAVLPRSTRRSRAPAASVECRCSPSAFPSQMPIARCPGAEHANTICHAG